LDDLTFLFLFIARTAALRLCSLRNRCLRSSFWRSRIPAPWWTFRPARPERFIRTPADPDHGVRRWVYSV